MNGSRRLPESFTEARDRIDREIGDLTSPEGRSTVVDYLAKAFFEIRRLKDEQQTLTTGLRLRDVIVQDQEAVMPGATFAAIKITARDAFDPGANVYGIEWDGDVAFRWTGPGPRFSFRLWLDRSVPMRLEIALQSYGDERNRGALSLTVDGWRVPIREVGDRLIESDQFSLVNGSVSTEVALDVPWLTLPHVACNPPGSDAKIIIDAVEPDAARARGVAVIHVRILPID